jgi:hypothetical protein
MSKTSVKFRILTELDGLDGRYFAARAAVSPGCPR